MVSRCREITVRETEKGEMVASVVQVAFTYIDYVELSVSNKQGQYFGWQSPALA